MFGIPSAINNQLDGTKYQRIIKKLHLDVKKAKNLIDERRTVSRSVVLGRIISFMRERHQEMKDSPVTLNQILNGTEQQFIGWDTRLWLHTEGMPNHAKIIILSDGIRFQYRPTYNLKTHAELIGLLKAVYDENEDGVLLDHILESLPNAEKILKENPYGYVALTRIRDKKKVLFYIQKAADMEQLDKDIIISAEYMPLRRPLAAYLSEGGKKKFDCNVEIGEDENSSISTSSSNESSVKSSGGFSLSEKSVYSSYSKNVESRSGSVSSSSESHNSVTRTEKSNNEYPNEYLAAMQTAVGAYPKGFWTPEESSSSNEHISTGSYSIGSLYNNTPSTQTSSIYDSQASQGIYTPNASDNFDGSNDLNNLYNSSVLFPSSAPPMTYNVLDDSKKEWNYKDLFSYGDQEVTTSKDYFASEADKIESEDGANQCDESIDLITEPEYKDYEVLDESLDESL